MPPDVGLAAARFVTMAVFLAMAGIPFYLTTTGEKLIGRTTRIALAVLALSAFVASLWWAAASVAAMAGVRFAQLDGDTFIAVLDATPLGTVLNIRLAASVALLAALAVYPRTPPLALIAFAALASSAWTGHSGAAEGMTGQLQRMLDVVHLGAASLWLGALLVFLSSFLSQTDSHTRVERLSAFARTGTLIVVLLAVTGTANAMLIGRAGWSIRSGWTLLLAAKIALFLAMLGFAALNRWQLTPALERGTPGAEKRLLTSLSLETACALAIVALVAMLGMLDPGGA